MKRPHDCFTTTSKTLTIDYFVVNSTQIERFSSKTFAISFAMIYDIVCGAILIFFAQAHAAEIIL